MKGNTAKIGVLIFLFLLTLGLLSYGIPRENFIIYFAVYAILFSVYLAVVSRFLHKRFSFFQLIFTAVVARLVAFWGIPGLSDDFYRFFWDGHMLLEGINPYAYSPQEFLTISSSSYWENLYPFLNSPENFSVYPPINQAIFAIAAWFGGQPFIGQLIIIRLILLIFECWSIFLMVRLFEVRGMAQNAAWWYALNPLVIIEVIGNLHFEGMMLPFILLAVLSLVQGKSLKGGLALGCAVGVKLTPLILIPLIIRYLGKKKILLWGIGLVTTLLISFSPLLWGASWLNFWESLSLYYGKFEFNASIYYLLREVGYWIKGYNTIVILSKVLALITFLLILFFSWTRNNNRKEGMIQKLPLIYFVFLLFSMVVHPWYLIPLLGLGIVAGMYFPVAWSFLVFLSYHAYQRQVYQESTIIIILEYALLFYAIYLDKNKIFHRKTLNFK
ncbi:polyprenol phosphomannose-dependent alpha 1,6 mannosyltransferase MptB [Echinicola jeungdonensis]|uniref:Polyprenol phosphomannose-dependent alpha 1,6 mannosyltransferase MptB n=1 Tax=Echinicola jeungdonensis TaxID=709343 RepID=A0ABV5J5N4_9BACT|nr:polyprenol phosphomannose-dependent alpha 1,6 mannosyltransferase MptB [Echinicola jeungdonensis]MDN3671017.1 polyprenol phosphomannose-dependent alpha 1,6 mannosyltransferase MptB [Echinicola jeungdonensis]